MPKLELTISPSYQRNWRSWECLREIVANGFDAEIEHNARCSIDYKNGTMRVENNGVTLPREALLMGHSTKMDRNDLVGKFGEGLCLSMLAALRNGLKIKIRTGSEVWVPSIQRSEKFNSDVLTVDIQTNRANENRVRVEISGVSKEDYDLVRSRFLKLDNLTTNDRVKTNEGSLLLSDKHKGKIFIRGVFIKDAPKLNYGYDFCDGTLNRDRDVVGDLDYRTKNIWLSATTVRPDLFDTLFTMIENDDLDVKGISQWDAPYLPDGIKDLFAAKFVERFGDGSIPVTSMGDSQEAEHFGRKGIVVSKVMLAILQERVDTLTKVKERSKTEITKRYSWSDLNSREKSNLGNAGLQVSKAINPPDYAYPINIMNMVEVVDFKSDSLEGLYQEGKLYVAKKMLVDEANTLGVLIHEWCHNHGGDGSKNHVYSIETTWANVYRNLISKG